MARPELAVAAWNHPLTNLLGWLAGHLAPGDTLAARLVWVSVLPAALAVACFYAALLASGLPRWLAGACGAVYMLSHGVWWHGTITESYAISLLLLNASLCLSARADSGGGDFRRTDSALLFVLAGLALANHVANAVLTPAALVWLMAYRSSPTAPDGVQPQLPSARDRAGVSVRMCGWWLLGALPFLLLVGHDLATRPGAAGQLIGGSFRSLMFRGTTAGILPRAVDLLVLQFPSPFILAVLLGTCACALPTRLWPASRRIFGPAAVRMHGWAIVVPTALFFGGYETWDRFAFFLPVFTLASLWGSQFVAEGWRQASRASRLARGLLRTALLVALAVSIAWPPWVYGQIRRWSLADGYWARRFGPIERQYRTRYDLVGLLTDPTRHDRRSLELFVHSLLEHAPQGAWIVDDMSTYYQIEQVRRATRSRADLGLVAVVPPFLADHGLDPRGAAVRVTGDGRSVLLVTTNGLCGQVAWHLRAAGYAMAPFELGAGQSVWRMVPPGCGSD